VTSGTRETRDRLIIEASDQGMPQRAIAKAVKVSQQRIVAIVLTRTGFTESAAS
jgi:transposase